MQLVSFPEKTGPRAAQLYPQAATAFPTVSKDGKTYTFTIRSGLKFSDGSPVTAASYQRAWERILSPKMGSPLGVNLDLQNVVVGGDAFLNGKAAHISGITAKGQTLTFHLTKPNATFVSILAMQWFTAVKPNMPYSSTGSEHLSGRGPVLHRERATRAARTVLKRNPYYKGDSSGEPGPDRLHAERRTSTSRCSRSRPASPTSTSPASRRPRPPASLEQYGDQQGPLLRRRDRRACSTWA